MLWHHLTSIAATIKCWLASDDSFNSKFILPFDFDDWACCWARTMRTFKIMNNEDLELIENRLMIATCFTVWVCFVMLPLNILRGYPPIYIIVLVGFQLSVAIGTSFQQSLLRKQFITPYSMSIRSFQLHDLFALNFLFNLIVLHS